MADENYTQCTLVCGDEVQVAWIPTELSKIGRHVVIHGKLGWVVVERHQTLPWESVRAFERFYDHWARIRGLRKQTVLREPWVG